MILRYAILPLTLLCLPTLVAAIPTVSNVTFVQDPDGMGSKRIRATYDLVSANDPVTISMRYSTDGGTTFADAGPSLSGAVGTPVFAGTGLNADWAIGIDLPGQNFPSMIIQILADDGAGGVSITNHSFETDGQPPATITLFPPTGWSNYMPANIDGSNDVTGTLNPATSGHFTSVPDGSNVALVFLNGPAVGEAGLMQTVGTLQANTFYDLSAEIGNIDEGTINVYGYFDLTGFPGYRVDLVAGSTVIASDNNSLGATIPDGEFDTSNISAAIGATHPELGQPLTIRLVNLNVNGTVADPGIEVDFDDVQLNRLGWANSASALVETIPPLAGTVTPPANATSAPFSVPFSGASDASGIALVELWFRTDSTAWNWNGDFISLSSGTFNFNPPGFPPVMGNYYFDLVAQDNLGNRTTEPSGMTGTGQGTTFFDTSSAASDWQLLE